MRHLISMLLQNEAGALARVAGLFASRGYNIESLTVAATHDDEVSRLTLTVYGDDATVEQVVKQSAKLVDVIEIAELTRREHLERELSVVRVEAEAPVLDAYLSRAGGRLLERTGGHAVVEYTGRTDEVDGFIDGLREVGAIADQARSGVAAVERASAVSG
ncbi:MAG: Acetolactate synthase isozyme 3 small subunit [Luteibacter sp.]|uniref:acetolactate synthase small subunit n=1 Tax=Luteibacter sp. TaxID=1886636 RepID=UPI00137D2DEF|nr:acetolactate synthase small subunit [Luteibacter sp.]KAF1005648.1 MAG: Acetolactate synthase isozyme 3 small subunit [Luteibacter sp.]